MAVCGLSLVRYPDHMVLGLPHHNNALDDLSKKRNVVDGTVVFQYFMLKVLQDRASEMLATRLTILNIFLQG